MDVIDINRNEKVRVALIDKNLRSQINLKKRIEQEFKNVDLVKFSDSREAIYNLWESYLTNPPKIDYIFLGELSENKRNSLDILEYCQYLPYESPVILISNNQLANPNYVRREDEYIWKICS